MASGVAWKFFRRTANPERVSLPFPSPLSPLPSLPFRPFPCLFPPFPFHPVSLPFPFNEKWQHLLQLNQINTQLRLIEEIMILFVKYTTTYNMNKKTASTMYRLSMRVD